MNKKVKERAVQNRIYFVTAPFGELAELVGVSRQTIMQLERNRYNPSMLLAYSIAKVFDVAIEDLFDFKEE